MILQTEPAVQTGSAFNAQSVILVHGVGEDGEDGEEDGVENAEEEAEGAGGGACAGRGSSSSGSSGGLPSKTRLRRRAR
jgi:hypothetical protein